MTTPPPPPPHNPDAEPLLTQRTVLVLLTASFIGTIIGVLVFFSSGNSAGALLAGLTGFGTSTLGLHQLIGH
ncbi:hypothetical protein [Streptomyces aureus]|uniref:hypothetical protein n=1 Tax=Streptomyces aureus TaxID=193461 RepID=UPI000563D0D5|nr:hypothetical protein [Streptomyces aureus]